MINILGWEEIEDQQDRYRMEVSCNHCAICCRRKEEIVVLGGHTDMDILNMTLGGIERSTKKILAQCQCRVEDLGTPPVESEVLGLEVAQFECPTCATKLDINLLAEDARTLFDKNFTMTISTKVPKEGNHDN